jgi:hypothetical protein
MAGRQQQQQQVSLLCSILLTIGGIQRSAPAAATMSAPVCRYSNVVDAFALFVKAKSMGCQVVLVHWVVSKAGPAFALSVTPALQFQTASHVDAMYLGCAAWHGCIQVERCSARIHFFDDRGI